MGRGWIEDGSGMDRGRIEDGSRMDPGRIGDGSRMDRGWIEDGVGISESHLAHVFDRGWTPELSARSEKQSSGLGLFIASTLSEHCGGELLVESQQSNGASTGEHSTTFTLSLPLDIRPAATN